MAFLPNTITIPALASAGGGFTPGGTSSQILRGDGTASSSLPSGIVSANEIRTPVTGTAGSGKAITDDGSSGLAWGGPYEPAITTLAKSKGGFGASIASVADGVLKFVSGVLTSVAQLGLGQGGTGVDLSTTGGATKILAQDASHVISARDLAEADLPAATIIHPLTSVSGQNAIAGTCAVTPAAGMFFRLIPANTSTLSPTININGAGAANLKRANGTDNAAPGETISGRPQLLYYDGTVYRIVTGQTSSLDSPATTGGTSGAYTLTDTRVGTPVDGQVFAFVPHADCGNGPTLAVNGGTAYNLVRPVGGGTLVNLTSAQISTKHGVIARYYASTNKYIVISAYAIDLNDLPSTMAGTTFASSGVRVGVAAINTIDRGATGLDILVRGGNSAKEAQVYLGGSGSTGACMLNCIMKTRAASTTYGNVLAVSTDYYGEIAIIDTTMTGNAITVVSIKAGVVVGIVGDTACYITGSPTGDQCKVEITGGQLQFVTGNTYTRTMGANYYAAGIK